ncbi:AP endonuclease, family 2 [Verrucomicrobiia bacterium DG1235]|nr:AP endonuclease, family 2 [Verrucomicrobiae bacterium DG1235]
MNPQSRREFLKASALAAAATTLPRFTTAATPPAKSIPKLNIFSKHLQFLDYPDMAKMAKAIGFDGIDLTVRPGGHVLPENVVQDLPRATEAINAAGLDAPMMTTAVDDAKDPVDRQVLSQAAKHGIKRYRMNWFPYPEGISMPETVGNCQSRIQSLSALNRELNLIGCYQNHAGTLVGASLWEVWQMLQGADPEHFGVQYDIRHATVEGGLSWPNGFRLVQSRIKTIVIKDFKWAKKDGRAEIVNTPVGEGMVDFPRYFRMLKEAQIDVPISLHLEYDIGGAQWGKTELTTSRDFVYEAMRKDIAAFRKLWIEA